MQLDQCELVSIHIMVYHRIALSHFAQARFQTIFSRHLLQARDPLKLSGYYFAGGAYCDMQQGTIGEEIVAVKVWRGVPWSVHDPTKLELEIVCFSLVVLFLC